MKGIVFLPGSRSRQNFILVNFGCAVTKLLLRASSFDAQWRRKRAIYAPLAQGVAESVEVPRQIWMHLSGYIRRPEEGEGRQMTEGPEDIMSCRCSMYCMHVACHPRYDGASDVRQYAVALALPA
jgi:hypothetical protein